VAYEKQTWALGTQGGTPLSAARFNHMEDGIADASDRLDAVEETVDEKADILHTHDGRYYVNTQVDALLNQRMPYSVKPFPPVTLTDASTISTDAGQGTHFRVTISGNRTLGSPVNATDGQVAVWEVTASGDDRTLTLAGGSGGFVFGDDVTEVPEIAEGTTTYVQAVYRQSVDRWRVIGVVGGY